MSIYLDYTAGKDGLTIYAKSEDDADHITVPWDEIAQQLAPHLAPLILQGVAVVKVKCK